MNVLAALICGLIVGLLFGAFKLPVPAPPTLAGVVGVAGITLGWWLMRRWTG